jgi:hypothetical protein
MMLGAKEFGPLFVGIGALFCVACLMALAMLRTAAARGAIERRIPIGALTGLFVGICFVGISLFSIAQLNDPAQYEAAQRSLATAIAKGRLAGHPFEETAASFLCTVRCHPDRTISDVHFSAEQELPSSPEGEKWQVNLSWIETETMSRSQQPRSCTAVFILHADGRWTEAGTRMCSNPR